MALIEEAIKKGLTPKSDAFSLSICTRTSGLDISKLFSTSTAPLVDFTIVSTFSAISDNLFRSSPLTLSEIGLSFPPIVRTVKLKSPPGTYLS